MVRRPLFWALFTVLSLALAAFSFWFFPRAFPIVSLDIAMSREAALAEARSLAQRAGWGPGGDVRAAASFEPDSTVQTFVELEGGGAEAFARMLRDGFYAPYTWRVRLFREGEANETSVRFTPEGLPFGFEEQVPEEAERPNIDPDTARALAEREAVERWSFDRAAHALVETSQERRPNGRVDHTFVYERRGAAVGEGRYRVRLVVSGNRVSEVTPFVRIPQGFSRRYEEMRSANTAIGAAGSIVGGLLYLVVGCGIGLFLLLRRRALLWRPALVAGVLIALAQVLAELNAWPLAWLQYDTAVPSATFIAQAGVLLVASALAMGALFTFSFMAAEGLSRLAFRHHPQFWRVWSREAAPTPSMAGRTAGGYLMVPFDLAYVMAFYFLAGHYLGWWNPSEALLNPDSLAHYQPWFTPAAMALQAGFWEECLFRAVPIAGAAVLGDRVGKRGLFIAVAFVVQAAIFGAGHAPYPAQPAYARPVELIVPSFVFGYLYLRYGLLPAIVLHYGFDIVLMALPIFAATGDGVWIDKWLVVVAALVPALVIVVRRVQSGAWRELPASLRNGGWTAPPAREAAPEFQPAVVDAGWPRWLVPALALVSTVTLPTGLWMAVRTQPEVPGVTVSRADAERAARGELDKRGATLQPGTRALVTVVGSPGDEDRFVWQTAGRATYEALLGSWLDPPRYRVRFARFEGDVAERADEWLVAVNGAGRTLGVRHRVPEARPGATLLEDQARTLALAALEREFGVGHASLREVSAVPSKLQARTDWSFAFTDTAGTPLAEGERRLRVDVAGDEVIGASRYVHVPEDWERRQRAADATLGILAAVGAIAMAIVLAAGAVGAVVAWSRGRFAYDHFLAAGLVVFAAGVAALLNGWPSITAQFSTAQPFRLQAMLSLGGGLVAQGAIAAVVAMVAGLVAPWRRAHAGTGSRAALLAGLLLGTALSGMSLLVSRLPPAGMPRWPNVGGAATVVPMLAPVFGGVTRFMLLTAVVLLVMGVADRVSAAWTRRRAPTLVLLFLIGASVGGTTAEGTLLGWAVSAAAGGTALAAAYWLIVRRDLAAVPLATASASAIALLPGFDRPYPGAFAGSLMAALVVMAVGFGWFAALRARTHGSA